LYTEYELDESLAEKNHVFGLMRRTLEKARGTVETLKLFMRNTAQDIPRKEPLHTIVSDTFNLIPAKYRSGMTLENRVDTSIEIFTSRIDFSQALLALLRNAIESMGGTGELAIEAHREQGYIILDVIDTGCGIPKEEISRIFRPFYTTKDKNEHSGLGLNIAGEILKKFGAEITMDSTPSQGSVFSIRYPLHAHTLMGIDEQTKSDQRTGG
jgi:two-component system NtrC family sensor kinase